MYPSVYGCVGVPFTLVICDCPLLNEHHFFPQVINVNNEEKEQRLPGRS